MPRQIIFRAAIVSLLAASFLTGCGAFRRMTAITALRNGIRNKFQIEDVQVTLQSNNELLIGLANPAYETATNEAKLRTAQGVAEFVRDNYRDIKTINSIAILLVTKKDGTLFRQDLAFRGHYIFNREAKLRRRPVDPNPPTPNDLLLYGDEASDGTVREGMRLFPSFGLHLKPNDLPTDVDFDLAAFSAHPIFKADHHFALIADGKTLADGTANFQSSGTIADGQTAEFMTITISYAKFKQLAFSSEAILIIGPKSIFLTDEQKTVFKQLLEQAEASVRHPPAKR